MKQLGTFIGLLALSGVTLVEAQNRERAKDERARAFAWKSIGRGGYLGVQVLPMTPELRTHFGAPEDRGVLVARVEEDSPAGAAGIQVGDVLTAVEGNPITGPHNLTFAVRAKKAGETVGLELLRERGALNVVVGVEERDRALIDLADRFELPQIIAPFPAPPGEEFFIAGPDGPLDEAAVKAFEEAMRDLEGRFQSEEWQEKLKRFRELDLTKIQDRMKEVEERLRALEAELEKEGKKKLD